MREITKKAKELAEVIKRQDEVLVVTHTDADGITSGSIALESLNRIGIEC
ncbi:MAG TPA: recombinase RecJ, partial [Archaeoglobus profundus]|nr:recombinase RecJ [Archaeoglobus profundus]